MLHHGPKFSTISEGTKRVCHVQHGSSTAQGGSEWGSEAMKKRQTHRHTVRIGPLIQKDSTQEVQHSYYIQSNREAGYFTQLNKKVVLLHNTRRQGNYKQLNKEANSIEEQPSGDKHRVGVRRQLWWAISAYIINILLTSAPWPRKALPSLCVSLGNGGGGLVVGGVIIFPRVWGTGVLDMAVPVPTVHIHSGLPPCHRYLNPRAR